MSVGVAIRMLVCLMLECLAAETRTGSFLRSPAASPSKSQVRSPLAAFASLLSTFSMETVLNPSCPLACFAAGSPALIKAVDLQKCNCPRHRSPTMQVSPPPCRGRPRSSRQGVDRNRDQALAWRGEGVGGSRESSSFSWGTERGRERRASSHGRFRAEPSRPERQELDDDEDFGPNGRRSSFSYEVGNQDRFGRTALSPLEYESNSLYEDLKGDRRTHVGSGLTPDQVVARAEKKLQKLADQYGVKSSPAENMPSSTSSQVNAPWPVDTALRSQLEDLGAPFPLPIQEAAFRPISEGRNVAIHSETGSGKTLSYLVPLLASMDCNQQYNTLIVVPSGSLARQVKSVVDSLLPAFGQNSTLTGTSDEFARIIGGEGNDVSKEDLKHVSNSPILISTPHAARRFVDELEQSFLIEDNLKTIVLDEADELLKSPQLANLQQRFHYSAELIERKFEGSDTERMLRDLLAFYDDSERPFEVQLVCASATIGQTLCRQIQSLLRAPSIEHAIVLVSGKDLDTEAAKSAKTALMPPTLEHRWVYVEGKAKDGGEDAELHDALFQAMDQLAPGRAIIFGKGKQVKVLTKALKAKGFKNVQHLRDAHGDEATEGPEVVEDWATAPVYVGGEGDARGLDLTVDYVFMLSPPVACSKYVHLAGRAGRNGRHGTAITLAKYHLVPDLISFSEKLAVAFTRLGEIRKPKRKAAFIGHEAFEA
mmetsp:Transcript_140994/g.258961  ORF Transcript_140994/g.258961 Transcript_140994/m.258961 type:complete len:710 (+) Transcript_140994:51-2180(+)